MGLAALDSTANKENGLNRTDWRTNPKEIQQSDRMRKLSMVYENASMDVSISQQCSNDKENVPRNIMKLL